MRPFLFWHWRICAFCGTMGILIPILIIVCNFLWRKGLIFLRKFYFSKNAVVSFLLIYKRIWRQINYVTDSVNFFVDLLGEQSSQNPGHHPDDPSFKSPF
jgi:hypothetical protein